MERVVISGVGAIGAVGNNIEEIVENVLEGKTGIKDVKRLDCQGCWSSKGGEISLSNEELMNLVGKNLKSGRNLKLERGELLLFKALFEALDDSQLSKRDLMGKKIGLFIGTSLCGFTELEYFYREFLLCDKNIPLRALLVYPLNCVSQRIRYELGIEVKIEMVFSTACSSSLHGVLIGANFVKEGNLDLAIVGGTDPLSLISFAGFSSLRSLAKEGSTPFSVKSVGLTIGEGAGVLILEKEKEVEERKKRGYTYFLGGGCTSDAYHPTASDPTGLHIKKAMEIALEKLNLQNSELILYAHGTGTAHNDMVEYRAFSQIRHKFKSSMISAPKSFLGHTLGASGALELALMCKGFSEQKWLPIVGFSEPRQGLGQKEDFYVGSSSTFNIGMKNSFAFGGNNVSVVLGDKRFLEEEKEREKEKEDKIVISGIGLVTAYNIFEKEKVLLKINEGETSIKEIFPIEGFSGKRISRKAAKIDIGKVETMLAEKRIKNVRKMDRISKIAVLGAKMAIEDAQITLNMQNTYKVGLVTGTATGGLESVKNFFDGVILNGVEKADAGIFPNTVINASTGWIAVEFGIRGYTTTLCQGASSGVASLLLAERLIKWGICETVVVGAYTEYSEGYHKALLDVNMIEDNQKLYSHEGKGFVLGEGAVFFVLEKAENTKKRGGRIYGCIEDIFMSCAPIFPNSYRHFMIREDFFLCKKSTYEKVQLVFGEGHGHNMVAKQELRALSKMEEAIGKNLKLTAMADYFGYIPGVNLMLNLGVFFLSNNKVFPTLSVSNEILPGKCVREKMNVCINNALFSSLGEGGVYSYVVASK